LEKKKTEKKKKSDKETIAELTDALQHLQADFENYKKCVEKDKAHFVKYAHASFIESLLPAIDSFELALKSHYDNEKFIQGMELIYSQLYTLLEKQGVRKIEALGKQFDPYKHEVMITVDSDQDGVVLEELQKGYMMHDKVLRHTKVKIGKKNDKKEEKNVDIKTNP